MESKKRVVEPNFEGEEMYIPETMQVVLTEDTPPEPLLSKPIIVLLFLILATIIAGFYYWYTIVMSEQVPKAAPRPDTEPSTALIGTTTEASINSTSTKGTADNIEAIEADVNSINFDDVDNTLSPIESELNEAISAE